MLNRRDFLKGLAVVAIAGAYSGPLFAGIKRERSLLNQDMT